MDLPPFCQYTQNWAYDFMTIPRPTTQPLPAGPSSTKCGRCREPLLSEDPRTNAVNTATRHPVVLCASCAAIIQRFRVTPPPSA